MNWRRERDLFFLALQFLTRIPIPTAAYSPANFNSSARYFPLVGALVGAVGALVFFLAQSIWPTTVAIALSMMAAVLLTGALHEDGFADSCDGFGGGWQREHILAIMKDSRIGNYAAIGLILIFAIKFFSLLALAEPAKIVGALCVAHAWSRLLSISYLFDTDYVRDDDTSKVRPMATQLSRDELLVAGLMVAPLLLVIELWQLPIVIATLLTWRWLFGTYIKKRIGGYTGDCLGCAQQVGEVLIYLALSAS